VLIDPDPDLGGPKTYGSGSATLLSKHSGLLQKGRLTRTVLWAATRRLRTSPGSPRSSSRSSTPSAAARSSTRGTTTLECYIYRAQTVLKVITTTE
jgi:hypothetical protein